MSSDYLVISIMPAVCLFSTHRRPDVLQTYPQARADDESRAWNFFCLAPYMLLHRPCNQGSVGKEILEKRFDDYAAGSWANS